jgi:hypothetical protein
MRETLGGDCARKARCRAAGSGFRVPPRPLLAEPLGSAVPPAPVYCSCCERLRAFRTSLYLFKLKRMSPI